MAGYGMADYGRGPPEQVRISGHQGYFPQDAGGGGGYPQGHGNPYGYYSEDHDAGPPSSPKEVGRQRHAQALSLAQEEYQQLQEWQQAEQAQQHGHAPLNDYRAYEHGGLSSVDTRTAWQHPVRQQQPEGLVSGEVAASLVAANAAADAAAAAAAAAPPAAGYADMPYFSTRTRPAKRHVLRPRGPAPLPVPAHVPPKPATRSAGVQACVLQDEGRRQTDSAHDEVADASPRDRALAAAAAVAHVAAARLSPLQHEQLQQQQEATDMQMGWYKYGATDYAALPASVPPARSADPRRVRMSC